MLFVPGERTLMGAIIPPRTGHINGIIEIAFSDESVLPFIAGVLSSVPYDFYIKVLGKSNMYDEMARKIPVNREMEGHSHH